jgi:phage shock protein A
MDANEKTLNLFATRMRQLILQYKELKEENAALVEMVDELEKQIAQFKVKLTQAESEYNSLKMAKMIEISDTDLEGAKSRLSKLIRDVNKCITLLSEQN